MKYKDNSFYYISLFQGNDGPNTITSWSKNHDTSLNICMKKNQLLLAPLQYCTNGHRDQSTKSWTNVFREVYEYELTKGIH